MRFNFGNSQQTASQVPLSTRNLHPPGIALVFLQIPNNICGTDSKRYTTKRFCKSYSGVEHAGGPPPIRLSAARLSCSPNNRRNKIFGAVDWAWPRTLCKLIVSFLHNSIITTIDHSKHSLKKVYLCFALNCLSSCSAINHDHEFSISTSPRSHNACYTSYRLFQTTAVRPNP